MSEAVGGWTDARPAQLGADLVPARLDEILRARLGASRKPPPASAIARELRSLAPLTFGDARWFAALDQSLVRLRGAGAVDAAPTGRTVGRSTKGAPGRARKPLGLRAAISWRRVHDQILPGLGLGIAVNDRRAHARLRDHRDWAGAVLARARKLWAKGPPPAWAVTCDALVWSLLDLPGKPKKTPPEIQAHFLAQILDRPAERSPARLLALLAGRLVEAVRPDLRSLKEGLSRRWLAGREDWPDVAAAARPSGSLASATAAGASAVAQGLPATPLDLPAFAALVRRAASEATEGVFGPRKVFISRLWGALRVRPAMATVSLEQFKRHLIAAHKAGLLVLARADLVAAMDPRDVAESETAHLEARYHFVEREGEP